MNALTEKQTRWLISLLLAVSVFAVFWPALKGEFINYDDPAYVSSNIDVQHGFTLESVKWAFTTGHASNWHPLTWLSHTLDYSLYGDHPWGHHLTNLIFHATNAILLFLLLNAMTGAMWRSAVVAVLFALHPLRVESVAWISERKDVLSTFFFMLTLWTYLRYVQRKTLNPQLSTINYTLSLLFFTLGLLSKPMLVTLPCVLLLLDLWPLNRLKLFTLHSSLSTVFEKIPFLLLALASSVITFLVQRKGGAVSALDSLSISARFENAFVAYIRYLAKTFWPAKLSVLYPHPGHWPMWQVIGAIIILLLITAAAVWRLRQQPYIFVGWFWFVGILIPAIGIIQVGIQSMADRYSYVPIIGVFIIAVWGLADILTPKPWGKKFLTGIAAVAVIICCILTPIQVSYWHDSESIFLHAVAVTDKNYLAYNNLGFFFSNKGKIKEAIEFYKESLKIEPNYEDALNNMGYALAALGQYQEAIPYYIKALTKNKKLTEAHNNLGNALSNVGQLDAAIHEYEIALEENPKHADAHNNYGIALAMKGRIDEAIKHFQLAVQYKENYSSAHSNLGNAYAATGKFDDAIREYQLCLQGNPDDAQAHNNLANVLAQQNKPDEAIAHYRTALRLKTENPEAHFNLGFALAHQGHTAEAEAEYLKALQQRPNYPDAQNELNALRASVK